VPYIGKQLVRGQNRKLDDISSGFNGSQTTFTLQIASQNVSVGSALQLWISVGGVIQNPLTDFTIAGNQITFTTAPAASLDFFGVIQGDVTDTNTPGDATVTTSKLATGLTVNLADGSAATSSLQLGGTDSGLFSSAADKVNVTTGGVERLEIGSSEVVFNDPSNDVDFRVESNGNANMLFVDGGNDAVGIGTSSPSHNLTIRGSTPGLAFVPTADTQTMQIAFRQSADSATRGAIRYDLNTNALAFDANSSERARIDSSGRLLLGTSTARAVGGESNPRLHIEGSGGTSNSWVNISRFADSAGSAVIQFGKSRSNTPGTYTVVQNNDALGSINFAGADGTDLASYGAKIAAEVDGTPGANDMPGRITFSTTADGASTPTERLRIDSSGRLLLNGGSDVRMELGTNGTTGTNDRNHIRADGDILKYNSCDNGAHIFEVNGTERLRIDSSGTITCAGGAIELNANTTISGGALSLGGGATVLLGNGNATFGGALSKGSGSFKISHPLPAKTETHHLVHSFIEGPQADLIYRGYVDLVDGQATVNIDTAGRMTEGTFEVLCTNVSCFTSNESDWTAVKGSVTGNVLTIAAQDATATSRVSWMVVGERKDQHMLDTEWTDDAGRVITEPEKVVETEE
jgi:hypothetical protein